MSSELPLVSAIMPTRNRPQFAREAVELFRAQTYLNKELVILDDAEAPSFSGGVVGEGIVYERLRGKLTVGEKRNIACSRARGEIIIHLDDDDFSAPGRFEDQVSRLLESGQDLTGYTEMLFWDGAKWWLYRATSGKYILGTSFCYLKSSWQRHPFGANKIGEDLGFQLGLKWIGVPAGNMMWARTHPGNTSPRATHKINWQPVEMQCA